MLIERDNELQTLKDLKHGMGESGGRVVLICGEAGIGKSSLIQSFLGQLPHGVLKATGLCDPLLTPRPMGAVREVIEELSVAQPLTDWRRCREDPLDGFLSRLRALKQPAVLVIEDAHWADQSTLDWLKYTGRRIASMPVLLLVSFRDDEVLPTHPLSSALGQIPSHLMDRVVLPPLSAAAIGQLDKGHLYDPDALRDITGGNPFFITEMLSEGADQTSVPASVKDAVNARLNRLDRELQKFLEYAACIPSDIRSDLLARIFPDTCETSLSEATHQKFLVPSGEHYRFRHELARLAIYNRLSSSSRQSAHRVFLEALRAEGAGKADLDDLLHHARGAQDGASVLDLAPQAAKAAADLGAHREAANHLAAALEFVDEAPTELAARIYQDWAYEAGLAQEIDERVIEARRHAITLWRTLNRMDMVGENVRWLSRLHWYRGEAVKAKRYAREAVDILENEENSSGKAMAYAVRAQFHMLSDEMPAAIEWGERALAMAREIDDAAVAVHALNTVGTAKLFRGDNSGEALMRESLELAQRHALHEEAARVYTNLSECLIESGRHEDADELLKAGIAFDTAHDLDAWTYYLIGRQAQLRLDQGRYQEAINIADGVLSRAGQTVLMQLPARIVRARAGLRLGHQETPDYLREARDHALMVDEVQYTGVIGAMDLEAACLAGREDEAAHLMRDLDRFGADELSDYKRADLLFWAVQCGGDVTGKGPDHLNEGLALAMKGDWRGAAKVYGKAGDSYKSGWCFLRAGNAEDLAQADGLFRTLEAQPAQRFLRQTMSNNGLDVELPVLRRGPYQAARAHPYGLTQKEQDVLRLIASGEDNPAIARRLSRSRRTVENHVSSILNKLGAKNRVEVILRTQSEPWLLS